MTKSTNALIAYKNKQYNLLRAAYRQNVAALRLLIKSNILTYKSSSIAAPLKKQLIKNLTIIFYSNLVKLIRESIQLHLYQCWAGSEQHLAQFWLSAECWLI